MTEFVTSADGTRIAYDVEGSGPPVILIGGAMQFRAFDPITSEMAQHLADHGFAVVNYDRRGRGESPADAPVTPGFPRTPAGLSTACGCREFSPVDESPGVS